VFFLLPFGPHGAVRGGFYDEPVQMRVPADVPAGWPPGWMGVAEGMESKKRERPNIEHYSIGEDAGLGLVRSQDSKLLPVVQKGMRSRGFKGQLWCEQEQRLRHFHVELERRMSDD